MYLAGPVAGLTPDRQTTYLGFVPWWVFYVVGILLWVGVPWIVWRGHALLTRIIAIGPAGKALVLFWQVGRQVSAGEPPSLYRIFFAATAVTATCLLCLAGWGSGEQLDRKSHGDQTSH
ncbi:MAG: hypothetical protein VX519_05135 [Myxococcota bacterium]|nr:hypothetical protein [Myxococcota bacterium]